MQDHPQGRQILFTSGETEHFIVEGASTGGAAKMSRDRNYQALIPLRVKVLNVLAASSAKLTSNKEISDLFLVLGAGSIHSRKSAIYNLYRPANQSMYQLLLVLLKCSNQSSAG